MPTNVKCMLIFKTNGGYGWTETHYLSVGSDPPLNLGAILDRIDAEIVPVRRVLMGEDCEIVGLRASYKISTGVASLNRVTTYFGKPDEPSSSQNDSLAVQMVDGTQTRKKIVHLRGIWDSVVEAGDFVPTNGPGGYQKLLDKYQATLIANGYGWVGKSGAASVFGTVTGYTQLATNQIQFTVQTTAGSANFATLFNVGQPSTFECRISKLNRSNSNLNRSWVVAPTTIVGPPVVNQITTQAPIGTGEFQAPGKFNISIGTFIAYSVAGPTTLGERRMGKVLGHYPGRRPRRPVI
jgi:hypothetical protein